MRAEKTVIKLNNLIANRSIYPSRLLSSPLRFFRECAAEKSGVLACVVAQGLAAGRGRSGHPSYVSEYTHQRSISRPVPSRLAPASRSGPVRPRRHTGAHSDFGGDGRTDADHIRWLVVVNAAIGDAQWYNSLDQFGHRFVSNRRPTELPIALVLWRHQVDIPIDCQTLYGHSRPLENAAFVSRAPLYFNHPPRILPTSPLPSTHRPTIRSAAVLISSIFRSSLLSSSSSLCCSPLLQANLPVG